MKKLFVIGLLALLSSCGKETPREEKASQILMQAIIEREVTPVPTGEGQKGWSLPKPQSLPRRKKG